MDFVATFGGAAFEIALVAFLAAIPLDTGATEALAFVGRALGLVGFFPGILIRFDDLRI